MCCFDAVLLYCQTDQTKSKLFTVLNSNLQISIPSESAVLSCASLEIPVLDIKFKNK